MGIIPPVGNAILPAPDMMIAWYRQIDNAKSTLEVVAVARDYSASWTPQELARLPPECRPGKLRDESDIEFLHDILVEEYRNSHASGEELARLQELTSFLVCASMRITELSETTSSSGSSTPSSEPIKSADHDS